MIAAVALTCAAADDPGGWSKAKWGMTEPQLADAFGSAMVRLDPPERISGRPIHLAVDLDLAATPFRALLIPDADGHLSSVLLSPRSDKNRSGYTFAAVQQLLVQKYGRPWKSEAKDTTSLQWSLPTTVITLTLIEDKQFGFAILTLQYKRKLADDTI